MKVLHGESADLTAEQVAEAFWELGSDEHCRFFAHLNRIAGVKLCFQMAGVVYDMTKLSDAGEHDAISGFRTMLAHAQEMHEAMTEIRCDDARRGIVRFAGTRRTGDPA